MWTLAADIAVAVISYAAAWTLRFNTHWSDLFSPGHRAFVVAGAMQLAAIGLARGYLRAPLPVTLKRFLLGTLIGSSAGAIAAVLAYGRSDFSISVHLAATVLFVVAGTGWRCAGAARSLPPQPDTPADIPEGMHAIGAPTHMLLTLGELLRYRMLVASLVARDLKLKYRGSVLGFFWSLLNPLVMVAVYTVVFTFLMPIARPGEKLVVRLLISLLAWGLFANSAMMSTGTIVDSGGLIKNIYFPRSILPLAAVLFNLAMYLLTLVVFLPVLFVIYRIAPAVPMLAFPFFLLLQVTFTIGVALALSAATATFRDIKHLTEIAISVLFWLTPIFYSTPDMHPALRLPILLSPMSSFVVAYQDIFYAQQWPAVHLWALALFFAATSLVIGGTLFFSVEARFGEQV